MTLYIYMTSQLEVTLLSESISFTRTILDPVKLIKMADDLFENMNNWNRVELNKNQLIRILCIHFYLTDQYLSVSYFIASVFTVISFSTFIVIMCWFRSLTFIYVISPMNIRAEVVKTLFHKIYLTRILATLKYLSVAIFLPFLFPLFQTSMGSPEPKLYSRPIFLYFYFVVFLPVYIIVWYVLLM